MLQDPENPDEEWSFEIFAKDFGAAQKLGAAQKQCQAIADTGELESSTSLNALKPLTSKVNIVLFAGSDPR